MLRVVEKYEAVHETSGASPTGRETPDALSRRAPALRWGRGDQLLCAWVAPPPHTRGPAGERAAAARAPGAQPAPLRGYLRPAVHCRDSPIGARRCPAGPR